MAFEVKGLRELQSRLENLARNAASLDGQHEIPLSELLTSAFLTSCSPFSSLQELFDASGFTVETPEDFKAIPDELFDAFIQERTSFSSWEAMMSAAVGQWTKKKLGF